MPPMQRTSAEWPEFKRWLEAEIEKCRLELESPECRAIAHADQLRGKIMAYRGIIAAVEPVIPVRVEATRVPGQSY